MRFFYSYILIFLIASCGQSQIKTPIKANDNFEKFINKEKFLKDEKLLYPGIVDLSLKPILTKKINDVAKRFQQLSKKGIVDESEYQNSIKEGLNSFSSIYIKLDTEERERICSYFEEIMTIVGLESSNGQLNNFMYGFDPN